MMDDTTRIIRDYYDAGVETEWNRVAGRPEFLLTCRFLNRYIKPRQTILDIGGGPGRYSLYLAEQGCDVALLDLSSENVRFAGARAAERGLSVKTIVGDARETDKLIGGQFDHVLLMGPLYHLLEEADRVKAVESSLRLLKPGGILFASFISAFAGAVYMMKNAPDLLASTPMEIELMNLLIEDKPFAGAGFTECNFERHQDILPFFEQFPLTKLHFLSQEGILSPCEQNIMSQPETVIRRWLNFAEQTCEREDLLSWSEHLMYIGQKTG